MAELLDNETFVWGAMALISFLVTQGLKWAFVKPFTKNLDKKKKTIINSIILLIAFGSAVLCEFLYSHFWLNTPIDINRVLNGWGGASGVYGVFEYLIKLLTGIKVTIENPYKTEEFNKVNEVIVNVAKDGKIDKSDAHSIKDFVNRLNSIK